MENTDSLADIISSINNSIEDLHNNPIKSDHPKSDMEIILSGIASSDAISVLFSPKMDELLQTLVSKINLGDITFLMDKLPELESVVSRIFTDKLFKGPVSTAILNNIENTMTSGKYEKIKAENKKLITTFKKIHLIMKNLKAGNKFKKGTEERKKYDDSVYAIKQTLKFVRKVYFARKVINRRVLDGLNNIVHESAAQVLEE